LAGRSSCGVDSGRINSCKKDLDTFSDSRCITSETEKMVGLKLITVAAFSGLALAVPNIANKGDWKSKIKNVVILVEENRSFDTFAGGLSYSKEIDGLLHHNYCNSM
jgi:phospholipase C